MFQRLFAGIVLFVGLITASFAQQIKKVPNQPLFRIQNPDYATSPITGVTRKHWKDAALYLLQGAFSYIDSMPQPMVFPKLPGKSYPIKSAQLSTEKMEGLSRTLLIAAPLLKEDSNLVIHHIRVADYYRYHMLRLIDSTSNEYIAPRPKNGGANQKLVEFGALSLSFFAIPDVLWKPLAQKDKDALAATMLSYGDGPTVPSNWKFFNIFVLSFLKDQGYRVNETLLETYLQKALAHYTGNGWYNDNPAYDYYSMWAFQMYGPYWAEVFGKRYYPQYAQAFQRNFTDLEQTYPYLFSKNGEMIMWGRSMSYRFAAAAPLAFTGFEKHSSVNYGWMRRIATGNLLQFILHPNFLQNNVPVLGFYGAFEPAVQSYTCRGSVYWMGKLFYALLLPPSNPFWAAKENNGPWEKELQPQKVYNRLMDSSHILITNYPSIGASEVRAWCNTKAAGASEPFRASENYNRLSYNSAFPWQADSVAGVVAMNYLVLNRQKKWEPFRLYTYKKFENGVYYRNVTLETNNNVRFQLADMPLPNGILRIDKNNSTDTVTMRLGHYALPQLQQTIVSHTQTVDGYRLVTANNGSYQLAMVAIAGWDSLQHIVTQNVHPQAPTSGVINASANVVPAALGTFHISFMAFKKAGVPFTKNELLPFSRISVAPDNSSVTVYLKDGTTTVVRF